jgi:hypothetical protein
MGRVEQNGLRTIWGVQNRTGNAERAVAGGTETSACGEESDPVRSVAFGCMGRSWDAWEWRFGTEPVAPLSPSPLPPPLCNTYKHWCAQATAVCLLHVKSPVTRKSDGTLAGAHARLWETASRSLSAVGGGVTEVNLSGMPQSPSCSMYVVWLGLWRGA